MKFLVIGVLISLSYVSVLAQTYSNKYDGMNIDEVIANKRLFKAYIKCVLEKGKCTPEGKELKNHITDALKTGCTKCTDPQRKGVRKVIGHLINHEQKYWKQLVEKYDPKGEFSKKYEKELKEIRG